MAERNNAAIKGYNAKIMGDIDGKTQKTTNLTDKYAWIPASAGMTTLVGGNSH
jgi:hypothetical protein